MKDFGYSINKQRVIDLDKNTDLISKKINNVESSFALCIGCGTCTATCTANNFTEFNLRKLLLLVKRGETNKISEEIAKCMFCGKCTLLCPRGVNTRNLLLNIYNINQSAQKK